MDLPSGAKKKRVCSPELLITTVRSPHGAEEAYKAINTVADGAIPDVKTTDKFAAEIYEFYRAGILTGSDAKGTFHVTSEIKRSEAAAILLRMLEASARKSITMN